MTKSMAGWPFNCGIPDIPGALWALMGISAGTLVASPLILTGSKAAAPEAAGQRQLEQLGQQGYNAQDVDLTGPLFRNKSPQLARWSDLMTGEKSDNCTYLDLTRLQMCFFTLCSLLAYGVLLAEALSESGNILKLPALPEGLLAIIGISHGGYLVSKASQNSAITNPPVTPISSSAGAPGHPQSPAANQSTTQAVG